MVPEFAVGQKPWGEFVTGGSPNSTVQSLALRIFQAQLDCIFELHAVWLPRELNSRTDYLSLVSELLHNNYLLRPELFQQLDSAWGPRSVDRHRSLFRGSVLYPPRVDGRCGLPLADASTGDSP